MQVRRPTLLPSRKVRREQWLSLANAFMAGKWAERDAQAVTLAAARAPH
jgi:hypothetical protein